MTSLCVASPAFQLDVNFRVHFFVRFHFACYLNLHNCSKLERTYFPFYRKLRSNQCERDHRRHAQQRSFLFSPFLFPSFSFFSIFLVLKSSNHDLQKLRDLCAPCVKNACFIFLFLQTKSIFSESSTYCFVS